MSILIFSYISIFSKKNYFKILKYFDIATSVLNVARHDEGGIKKIQPYWAIRPGWQMGLKK